MLIPTVPAFTAGDISVAKLQQLSQCVSFVSNAQGYPVWHVYKPPATTQAFSAITWTSVSFSATAIDSDRVSTGGNAITIHTQGYYAIEACVPIQTQATLQGVYAGCLWTAGPSNPHFASGSTNRFAIRSGYAYGATGADEAHCISDLCPVVCFPGDTLAVQVFAANASTIDANNPAGAVQGRFVCNFTGRWVRTGS